jgi:AraC family transcriptional regulator
MNVMPDGQGKYPRSTLLMSSADRGWSTISAELRAHPAGLIRSAHQPNVEIVLAICAEADGFVVRTGSARQEQTRATPGAIWLVPSDIGREEIALTAPMPRALHLYLPTQQFTLLAKQYGFSRSPIYSLQYLGGLRDTLIQQIGEALLAELATETTTGRMLAETSSLMLAAWLAHRYSDGSFVKADNERPQRLDKIRLRRVLDYIELHLEEEITVSALAELANLSAFHFIRMFTATLGVPPFRYVSRCRLERAMSMLADGTLPLVQIAHRSGFASQASFNRAFRRAVGMTPGEYRRLLR